MNGHARGLAVLCGLALAAAACGVPQQRQIKSNALDYLYPEGAEVEPAGDVRLELPVRVGLAFAPSAGAGFDTFTETQKHELLERVAAAFREREGIGVVEAIPSAFLEPEGGFANVDRIARALGIDLVALISYDQFQFSETGKSSWTYWTIIGAYIVKGEKNETRTMMDAVIYDIPSRALLFHAAGENTVRDASTPVDAAKVLRARSEESFRLATDDLIANLDLALEAFEEQAASGTVRGEGTPSIAMVDSEGRPIAPGATGGGSGSIGLPGAVAAALLALATWAERRAKRRSA